MEGACKHSARLQSRTPAGVRPPRGRTTGESHHRLLAFFILAYAISWASWPFFAAGLLPRMEFLPVGPLAAAVIVIALTEGRPGFRTWGRRLIRWRVGWVWYAVALLLPATLVLVTGIVTMALGAAAPGLERLTWGGLMTVFAVRLVNPLDGALGEEPGFRGYALPLLQASRPPLLSASILGVLVTLWHLPLVLFGGLSAIGLPTTFAITFLYVWLFNRTGGSVLLTFLFHNSQGTFTVGSFGFAAADAGRAELIYFLAVVLAVLATVVLDRQAWRKASRSATAVGRFPRPECVPCERRRVAWRSSSPASSATTPDCRPTGPRSVWSWPRWARGSSGRGRHLRLRLVPRPARRRALPNPSPTARPAAPASVPRWRRRT
jgi:membrane protease YdiL (CAAX protease family)